MAKSEMMMSNQQVPRLHGLMAYRNCTLYDDNDHMKESDQEYALFLSLFGT